MKDLYSENCKTSLKEILKNWKDILCLWLEDLILLRCKYYPSNLQIQCNSYQNPSDIFLQRLKKNPKIQMASQGTLNRQNNPDKEEQSWRTHTSRFWNTTKLVIKTVWHWHIDRHIYRPMEWNRQPRNKPSHIQSKDSW